MKVEIIFSEKIHFMSGEFPDTLKKYDNQLSSNIFIITKFADENSKMTFYENESKIIVSTHLPDASDGINKISIYCDQVGKSFVGDSKSQLLTVVSQQFEGQGSTQLYSYSPAEIYRKFINKLKIITRL